MGRKQTKKLIQKFVKKQKVSGKSAAVSGVKSSSLAKTSKGARAIDSARKKSGGPTVQSLIAKEFKKRKRAGGDPVSAKDAKTDAEKTAKRKLFDGETGKAVAKATANGNDDGDVEEGPSAINGAMSIEDFLAGGFKADPGSDEDDEDDEADAAQLDDDDDDEDEDDDDEEEEEEEEEEDAPKSNGAKTAKTKTGKAKLDEESDEEDDDDEEEDESDDEEAAERHKAELEALKEKDPEFYKYLQQENAELLNFGESDDEDEDEDADKATEGENVAEKPQKDGKTVVSFVYLRKLEKELKDAPSLKTIKTMVRIFATVESELSTPEGEEKAESNFRVPNELAKERVLRVAMTQLATAFDTFLSLQRPKIAGRRKIVSSHKRWSKLSPVASSFLGAVVRLMSATIPEDLQSFVLRHLLPYGIYICGLPPKVLRKFVKVLTTIWGNSRTADRARLLAFSCLRRLATECGTGPLPDILKPVYLEFVRGSKHSNAQESGRIAMQAKCLVDLFGIDLSVTYQLAFVYIRQLALHLRAAIISKTSESTRGVYGWQFVHCLRLWGVVLSSYPGTPKADEKGAAATADDHQLRSLIYPLIQVITGTIRLAPAARNFPVRFHCVAILNNLTRSSRFYIPCAPLLLDVLACKELQERPSQATMVKEPKLEDILSLNKNALAMAPTQIALVRRTTELLEDFLDSNRFSIAFPEVAFPVAAALRSFRRKCKVPRAREEVKALISKIDGWIESIKQKREKSDFAPNNVARMNAFLSEEEEAARAQRAIEKAAALSAAESTALHPENLEAAAAEVDDEDDDDEVEDSAQAEDDQDDDEDAEANDESSDEEDEEETPAPKTKKSVKKPTSKKAAAAKKAISDEDEGDLVEDMEMSSDEE